MKTLLTLFFTLALSSFLFAETEIGGTEPQPAKAIVFSDGSPKELYIIDSNAKGIIFVSNPNSVKKEVMAKGAVKEIFFYTPTVFKQGLDAMRKGKFNEAASLFQQVKVEYTKVTDLDGNYGTLGAFYEIECARRSFDLKKMAQLADAFNGKSLQNKYHSTQVTLYPIWKDLQKKRWGKVIEQVTGFKTKDLTSSLSAQLSYLAGVAHLSNKQEEEAMLKLNEVLGLSNNREPELTVAAAKEVIDVILAKEPVQEALKMVGKKDENKASPARAELQKAAIIANYIDSLSVFDAKLSKDQSALLKLKL